MRTFKNWGRATLAALVLGMAAQGAHAQVGIGTETPQAKLHLHDGSLFGTTSDQPAENDPFYDPGIPLAMQNNLRWFFDKSAFRSVGERAGTGSLDPQNIGAFSFASGYETWAPGVGATALGLRTTAAGTGSLAIGYSTLAAASYAFAAGNNAIANGGTSVAIGENVSTNGRDYSFVFGTATGKTLSNDIARQMVMGFSGGYKFFTNAAASVGAILPAGANAWTTISDKNKKENFSPVNGETFLRKIAEMPLTSWNYKGQDPKEFRHYGPMAQDFYAAFGKDAVGTIGNDTTINQADFDGVNLIAIQALIHRVEQINSDLREEIASLKAEMAIRSKPSLKRVLVSKK